MSEQIWYLPAVKHEIKNKNNNKYHTCKTSTTFILVFNWTYALQLL